MATTYQLGTIKLKPKSYELHTTYWSALIGTHEYGGMGTDGVWYRNGRKQPTPYWSDCSCVTSTRVNNAKEQDDKALQKQQLKDRLQSHMAAQYRIIDSLIQIKDPRLKKDKNGSFIRPNSVTPSGKPLYYETHHGRSHRKAIKADIIGTTGSSGYNLMGQGLQ